MTRDANKVWPLVWEFVLCCLIAVALFLLAKALPEPSQDWPDDLWGGRSTPTDGMERHKAP